MTALFTLSILFLSITAFFVYSGFKYTRMISNIFLSLVYKPSLEVSRSTRGEKISILDSSDHEIGALLIKREPTTKAPATTASGACLPAGRGEEFQNKVVIFCHESGGSKESWEKYAYFLPELGYSVLSVDIWNRANEASENTLSQWPTDEATEKLVMVIRWAKKAFKPDAFIALFGVSNGADIALAASFKEASVRVVVADGLFSMKEIFRDYIRKWAPILVKPNLFGQNYPDFMVNIFTNLGFWYSQKKSKKSFIDVEKLLKQKHAPLLMIHGAMDDYVPETHQAHLEKINHNRFVVQRFVVPKAGHNQAVFLGRETYEKQIAQFLEKIYAPIQS